jgi:DNA-binding MarR family transcriptional regulator
MKPDAWELIQQNLQFYQTIMGRAEAELAGLNLETKSFFLLAAVEQLKYPAELARHCLLPRPTVSFLLKRLEKKGFIQRKSVAGDLRRFELVLTKSGRQTMEKAQVIVTDVFAKSFSQLTAKEQITYASLLAKMQT